MIHLMDFELQRARARELRARELRVQALELELRARQLNNTEEVEQLRARVHALEQERRRISSGSNAFSELPVGRSARLIDDSNIEEDTVKILELEDERQFTLL